MIHLLRVTMRGADYHNAQTPMSFKEWLIPSTYVAKVTGTNALHTWDLFRSVEGRGGGGRL